MEVEEVLDLSLEVVVDMKVKAQVMEEVKVQVHMKTVVLEEVEVSVQVAELAQVTALVPVVQ